jgi:hypothetical protein
VADPAGVDADEDLGATGRRRLALDQFGVAAFLTDLHRAPSPSGEPLQGRELLIGQLQLGGAHVLGEVGY